MISFDTPRLWRVGYLQVNLTMWTNTKFTLGTILSLSLLLTFVAMNLYLRGDAEGPLANDAPVIAADGGDFDPLDGPVLETYRLSRAARLAFEILKIRREGAPVALEVRCALDARDFATLSELPQLKLITIDSEGFSDKHLKKLAESESLRTIMLSETHDVTTDGIIEMMRMLRPSALSFYKLHLEPSFYLEAQQNSDLRALNLAYVGATTEDLTHLSTNKHIQHLHIFEPGPEIHRNGFLSILDMRQLRRLELIVDPEQVSDRFFFQLPRLSNLETFHINLGRKPNNEKYISEVAIAAIAALPKLKKFNISYDWATDNHLALFGNMQHLEELVLRDSKVLLGSGFDYIGGHSSLKSIAITQAKNFEPHHAVRFVSNHSNIEVVVDYQQIVQPQDEKWGENGAKRGRGVVSHE